MLQKLRKHIAPVLAVIALSGCSDDLSVQPDGVMLQVEIVDVATAVDTRAVPAELPQPVQEQFYLRVCQENGYAVYDNAFASEIGPFAPGKFVVTAMAGDNRLALDAPYYEGSIETYIYKGVEHRIRIPARVANSLVSVQYADANVSEMDSRFQRYAISFSLDGNAVELAGSAPAQSAYFPAGSKPEIAFQATKTDGSTVSFSLDNTLAAYFPLAAGEHARITLSLNADRVEIAKVEVEQVTINETVPQSWLPKPKTTQTGFGIDGSLTNVETNSVAEAKVDFTTSTKLQDIELTFNIQDPGFAHLNGTHLLSALTTTEQQQLAAAGIVLPRLGDVNGTIDLKQFAQTLQTNKGATTTNTVALRVKANDRWDSETPTQYTIRVNKPEFSITAQPEDMWSKEFTVQEAQITSGNTDVLKQKIRYQYSADGTTWIDFTNGKRQMFASHPATKNYQVRAYYREGITSAPISVQLENPTQLPNSGMEEWYYSNVARTINTYFPWSSGGSSFWNTNNSYTTRYSSSTGWLMGSYPYNCFPAVSYVVGGHSGNRAAEIRSTASGRGNTLPSNVLDLNKVPGELFTGEISVNQGGSSAVPSGDKYTIDENGRSFDSRPTALRLWYKYNRYGEDTWRAKIVLQDANHRTIVQKELKSTQAVSDWTRLEVPLTYTYGVTYAKCKYIFVVISSSVYSLSDSMPWQKYNDGYALWEDNNLVQKDASACWLGSILTIDDIELVYDK